MYLLRKYAYRDIHIQRIIERIQNKQQYGPEITYTELRKKLW